MLNPGKQSINNKSVLVSPTPLGRSIRSALQAAAHTQKDELLMTSPPQKDLFDLHEYCLHKTDCMVSCPLNE